MSSHAQSTSVPAVSVSRVDSRDSREYRDVEAEIDRVWEGYTHGFLRARGMRDQTEIMRVQRAVENWFKAHPPQDATDPFTYADAVIDCLRLHPSIPIEGPIAYIVQCLQPPYAR